MISLEPNPDDRRILQILLTPAARAQLAATTFDEKNWIDLLLLGLDRNRLAATTHVLRVIRHRLRRDQRRRS